MEKLMKIQSELKAPKNQYNKFGEFYYRSCEDILEGLKPILLKYQCSIRLVDEMIMLGDRYYVKATAVLTDEENGECVQTVAFAREELQKKGMDASQVTGSASSYARKYALNGMFAIDDTKDADTLDNREKDKPKTERAQVRQQGRSKVEQAQVKQQAKPNTEKNSDVESIRAQMAITGTNEADVLKYYKVKRLEEINGKALEHLKKMLTQKKSDQ